MTAPGQQLRKMKNEVTPFRESQKLESQSKILVLAVKILLVLLILFMLPKLVTTKSQKKQKMKYSIEIRALRFECQINKDISDCYKVISEDSLTCINKCMSTVCYDFVYGMYALEPGEIDIDRAKEFEICVKDELRANRKNAIKAKTTRE
jgi:Domain of unknown function (DUF4787)